MKPVGIGDTRALIDYAQKSPPPLVESAIKKKFRPNLQHKSWDFLQFNHQGPIKFLKITL